MRQRWVTPFSLRLLITFLLLGPISARAQAPDYFEQQQTWSMFQAASCGNVECYCVTESALYVDQDTAFEGHIYKRIGTRGIHYEGAIGEPDPMEPCNTQVHQFDGTFAYLRQSNDSVFIFNADLQTEGLFVRYDFQSGDTLYPNSRGDVVDSIDTITINGDQHRRFMYSGPGGSGVLIEGVVDIRGYGSVPLGGVFEGVFGTNEVGCFAENDSTVWTNPNGTLGCDFFTALWVEDPPRKTLQVAIHPNPASDVLNIKVAGPIRYVVTIRDLAGKQLFHKLNPEHINVARLAVGTYLIEVGTVDGQRMFRDKVVVTR